ncbi:glycosyltransferase family 2 protein [Ectopseudomonas khazarica]|uniref:glycosyltransferase family 2 protein n=1 Tax=Ectopseudomonas khazarica TaxID=2502979 RepID=UPI0037C8E65E
MQKNPVIAVLLSTYNGEKYLRQQLDSLLLQCGVDVHIYVRDDGSTDSTCSILSEYERDNHHLFFFRGENVGYVDSFFDILKKAEAYDYYAFCDQDDVWGGEKLLAAHNMLRSSDDCPAMYFSRTEYVDEALGFLALSPELDISRIGYENALVQNVATGCTIVFNRRARDLLADNLPAFCLVHDWWVYLVVSAFGMVFYDEKTYIKYRQHSGNAIGAADTLLKVYAKRITRFLSFREGRRVSRQLSEFKRLFYGRLSLERRKQLDVLCADQRLLVNRLRLIILGKYVRASRLEGFFLRLIILLGRF